MGCAKHCALSHVVLAARWPKSMTRRHKTRCARRASISWCASTPPAASSTCPVVSHSASNTFFFFVGKFLRQTINCSVGTSGDRLTKAAKVLEQLTGQAPCFSKARLTIRGFGIRRNERISTWITVQGEKAMQILEPALRVKEYELLRKNFSDNGNFGTRPL